MSSPIEPFRIDFSNFYKFVASIGLVLIAAAVAIPWFVMKAATPDAPAGGSAAGMVEAAIEARAAQYLIAVQAYPWVSGALLLSGIGLLIYGLIAWRARQKKQDEDEDEAFRQRRVLGETQKATPAETEEKLAREARSDASPDTDAEPESDSSRQAPGNRESSGEDALSTPQRTTSSDDRYDMRRRIETSERRVGELLEHGFQRSHSLETGVRIPADDGLRPVPIVDFVARARDPKRWTSFAAEVRVIPSARGLPASEWARRLLIRVAVAARGVPVGPLPRGTVGRPDLAKSVALSIAVVHDHPPDSSQQARTILPPRPINWEFFADEVRVLNSILSRPVGLLVLTESTLVSMASNEFHELVVAVLENPAEGYFDPQLKSVS